MKGFSKNKGSFRDPGGFIYSRDGNVYRQINISSKDDFDYLMDSGLYQDLVEKNMIVEHEEVDLAPFDKSTSYKVIQPTKIPFISYPYEWCFSQYQRAALATLEIQNKALDYGMTLKDASAYNIQFVNNDPVLIDTLSFEIYREGSPWEGYQQFCKHFFAPLLLMSYRDVRLNTLLRGFIDGIPLEIASILLPAKTRFNFSILAHIHLHAKAQERYKGGGEEGYQVGEVSKLGLRKEGIYSIVDSLEQQIKKLTYQINDTSWGDYCSFHNYSEDAYLQKMVLVETFIKQSKPTIVWDFGANTGDFSRLASRKGITTISFDIDPAAVEQGYLKSVGDNDRNIHHVIIDLFNPSPNLGWSNVERKSLVDRGPTDLLLALALIHHLAIANNLPLYMVSSFFSELTEWLVIEFVPKKDSQTKILLSSRRDIFNDYTIKNFEEVFSKDFYIIVKAQIEGTERTLYLMKKIAK